jgi:hypothetical protein
MHQYTTFFIFLFIGRETETTEEVVSASFDTMLEGGVTFAADRLPEPFGMLYTNPSSVLLYFNSC